MIDLNNYEILWPSPGKTLREQIGSRTLADQKVLDEILAIAQGLDLNERLKMLPESWGKFSEDSKSIFFLPTEEVDPKPIYEHSVPKDVLGLRVQGITWSKRDDGFFGGGPIHVTVCGVPTTVRTNNSSILDVVVGCDQPYDRWIPSYGILIEK